jgi:hypothetical protein
MSVDLFLVREDPLSWDDARQACDAVSEAHQGVLFWSMREHDQGCTAYFWNAARVEVSLASPDPDEAAEGDLDPPELANPRIVVSSRSGAWPWIEWVALTLAKALGARVFDPQSGEIYEEAAPEHDIAELLRLHEEDIRERQPRLVSEQWAFEQTNDITPAALRRVVDVVERVAHTLLGIPPSIALSSEQINVWHDYTHAIGSIRLSIMSDSYAGGGAERAYLVQGPTGAPVFAQFVDELGQRLGVRFRGIEAYK